VARATQSTEGLSVQRRGIDRLHVRASCRSVEHRPPEETIALAGRSLSAHSQTQQLGLRREEPAPNATALGTCGPMASAPRWPLAPPIPLSLLLRGSRASHREACRRSLAPSCRVVSAGASNVAGSLSPGAVSCSSNGVSTGSRTHRRRGWASRDLVALDVRQRLMVSSRSSVNRATRRSAAPSVGGIAAQRPWTSSSS